MVASRMPGTLLVALAFVAMIAGCGEVPEPPCVLMIAIDTLRPDHLGCYGYGRPTSPNLDELASGGVLFENAYSQAPWTLPSFASVFTSLYPTQHGATTVESAMGRDFPTLAEVLGGSGYATGAIVNAPVLRSEYHLNRGFDFYSEPAGEIERPAGEVTREALEWIGSQAERPFFAFVHYFDPHLAYAPPPPYDTLFDPAYSGALGNSFNLDYFTSGKARVIRQEILGLDQADRDHIVSLYDGEIAFTDCAVGSLLAGLGDLGLLDNTVVVLLSDHGEEFFEHGGLDHGHSLYEELIRVPLVIRFPGGLASGMRIARQVRLIDIMPTLIDYLDVPGEFEFEGVSLMPAVKGLDPAVRAAGRLLPPDECLSEAMRRTNTVKSITSFPWKLIEDISSGEASLFNLDSDPTEQRDLHDSEPERAAGLDATILRAAFAMTDTWFVEMGSGEGSHSFDFRITPERDGARSGIHLLRFLDAEGRSVSVADRGHVSLGEGLLIEDLEIRGALTLAFQPAQANFPVVFDIEIDGRRSGERVYLGKSLDNPPGIPFSQKPNRPRVKSARRPERVPAAPYVHIWHAASDYAPSSPARLSSKTRTELKSLGYVQ